MTFVICKKLKNPSRIIVHSDSKITDQYGVGLESELRQNSPLSGLLKTVILNPHVCFSFAGASLFATNFLKHFYSKPANYWNTDKFLSHLLDIHVKSDQAIDFIVCTSFQNTPKIYLIKDTQLTQDVDTAWIGNIDAFNLFQEHFLSNASSNIEERTNISFQNVINSNSISDVGGFHMQVCTNDKTMTNETVFLYELKMAVDVGPKVLHLEAGQAMALPTGTAQEGSYGVSYFRSYSPQKHGIAIHLPHGKFGILFCPMIDPEKGVLVKDVDGQAFADYILDEYDIPLQGFVVEKTGFRYLNNASK